MLRGLLIRFRATVPSGRVNYFVHAGNSMAVCASCSDDMIQLRSFMIGATCCSIAFNLLQPTPLWTPCYWGSFFIAAHSVQIARILRARSDVTMSGREHNLYENCFMRHGFTPRMFLSVLHNANASWETFEAGDTLCEQGRPAEKLRLVTGGTGSLVVIQGGQEAPGARQPRIQQYQSVTDSIICHIDQTGLRAGTWIGDCWEDHEATSCSRQLPLSESISPSSSSHRRQWLATAKAVEGSLETVSFDSRKFHEAVREQGKEAIEAAERMQIDALRAERMRGYNWRAQMAQRNQAKLRALEMSHIQQRNVCTYEAMIALAVADGVVAPEEREACAAFRKTHGINDVQHREALAKVGWADQPF